MTDQLEHQTLARRAWSIQGIRIGFQAPGSNTYKIIHQSSSQAYHYGGLQLTIFIGSRGLKPRIVTPKDNGTPAKWEIVEVDAPRRQPLRNGSLGALRYTQLTDIGPESTTLWCDFCDEAHQERAFKIMSNVEELKAETNELLKPAQAWVPGKEHFTQVHDIEDELDYINTCLLFLTLSKNILGKPMVDSKQLDAGVWHNLYFQINRQRGVDTSKYKDEYKGTNT
ncbi:hypothetical protein DFJ43DRAFT_1156825 [Lentinula guzmanii]|nr:hypothetical protein DFJ43DRAFT_1156825 [Lentinula guzmanii]